MLCRFINIILILIREMMRDSDEYNEMPVVDYNEMGSFTLTYSSSLKMIIKFIILLFDFNN